jgi:hypothetical protein
MLLSTAAVRCCCCQHLAVAAASATRHAQAVSFVHDSRPVPEAASPFFSLLGAGGRLAGNCLAHPPLAQAPGPGRYCQGGELAISSRPRSAPSLLSVRASGPQLFSPLEHAIPCPLPILHRTSSSIAPLPIVNCHRRGSRTLQSQGPIAPYPLWPWLSVPVLQYTRPPACHTPPFSVLPPKSSTLPLPLALPSATHSW